MVFDPNHRHLLEKIEKLEQEIKILKKEKANVGPFIWLNNRVGQVERRLDRLRLDDWGGDLEDAFGNLYQDGNEGVRYAVSY